MSKRIEELKKAATEMNDIMDMTPVPDMKTDKVEKLEKWIIDAIPFIDDKTDEFSKETQAIIDDLTPEEKKTSKTTKSKKEVDVNENVDLEEEINMAKDRNALADIAKEYDEFKKIRGFLSKYKTKEQLQDVMLKMIEKKELKETPTEKEEKSARKEKPATEGKPSKKDEPKKTSKEKTKFGHATGSQAGDIDEFLLSATKAFSFTEIADKLKLTEARIKSHIIHLEKEKGVKFTVKDDKYQLK